MKKILSILALITIMAATIIIVFAKPFDKPEAPLMNINIYTNMNTGADSLYVVATVTNLTEDWLHMKYDSAYIHLGYSDTANAKFANLYKYITPHLICLPQKAEQGSFGINRPYQIFVNSMYKYTGEPGAGVPVIDRGVKFIKVSLFFTNQFGNSFSAVYDIVADTSQVADAIPLMDVIEENN